MGKHDNPFDVLHSPAERRAMRRARKKAARDPDAAYSALLGIIEMVHHRGSVFASQAVAEAALSGMLEMEGYSGSASSRAVGRAAHEGILPVS